MAELRSSKSKTASASSVDSFQTPPPKVAAPSPKKPMEPSKPPRPPAGLTATDSQPAPATEGAKLMRLRRLCEVKPSGRCAVPTEVHERWKKGGKAEREAMVEEFERANWSKDPCWHIFLGSSFHKCRFLTNIFFKNLKISNLFSLEFGLGVHL